MHIYSRPIAVQETAKHRANLSLAVEPLQGKVCQNSLPSGGGRSLGAKISGGKGRPLPIYCYHAKYDCATTLPLRVFI